MQITRQDSATSLISMLTRAWLMLMVSVCISFCMAPISPTTWASELDPPPVYIPPGPEYAGVTRAFQGIPGLEIAENGRLWTTWYGGGTGEGPDNYVMLATSGNDGLDWTDVQMVIDPPDEVRAFDPCLWHDPQGRMWLFWAQAISHVQGDYGTWAMVADNSGAGNTAWSEPRRLCDGIMMNKPTVLDSGQWLLPTAKWNQDNSVRVVSSTDNGGTFNLLGTANVPAAYRNCDEPMIVEREDDSLWMLVRTDYGIGETVSTNGGATWNEVAPSGISHPAARFFVRRIDSGNLLMVKHSPPSGQQVRSHLTAYLSDDDGFSWQGGLLLDERLGVSYPDGAQYVDGTIYITYDYNRTTDRQILMSAFTESDVLAGTAVSPEARFRVLVNQAGVYPLPGEDYAIYREIFPNDDSADQPLSETGWFIRKGDGQAATKPILSYVTGMPLTATPVNSNEANSELADGYAICLDDQTGLDYFYFTNEFTLDCDNPAAIEARWFQRNSSGSDKVRLALEIGAGNWFVSDLAIQNNTANVWEQKSISLEDTAWLRLDFVPDTSLETGEAAELDAGPITGFGLYVDNLHSGRNRFDTFEIIQYMPGDANRDGSVDVCDLGILATHYGEVGGAAWSQADFTGDGNVDVSDLALLATNYGTATGGELSVPEPVAIVVMASLSPCILLSRRRRFGA